MNNDQWANVFGESAAVGLDSPAEPMSFTHNAQSNDGHAYAVSPAPAEHAYVPPEPNAESTKLKRTTIYLHAQHLAQLAAVDGQPAAWHVRSSISLDLDRLPKLRNPYWPPEQVLLIRSVGLSGAQSPAPRGAFCYGLLTDPVATHPRNSSQTPFRLRTS